MHTDPQALFSEVVRCLNDGALDDVASLCDPVSLRALQRQFLTGDDLTDSDDNSDDRPNPELSASDTFVTWLREQSKPAQLRYHVKMGWAPTSALRTLDAMPLFDLDYVVAGHVLRSPTTANILYAHPRRALQRNEWEPAFLARYERWPRDEQELHDDLELSYAHIATCRLQQDGGWLMLVDPMFLGLENGVVVFERAAGFDDGESDANR